MVNGDLSLVVKAFTFFPFSLDWCDQERLKTVPRDKKNQTWHGDLILRIFLFLARRKDSVSSA